MTKWALADIPSLHGRLAVVTGANSGIGWHTALELARAGSEVILASRTEAKGRDAVDRIRQDVPQAKIRAEVLDLASLRSVQSFAAKIDREAKLDLLINNAGVMSVPTRQVTEDGFELQFGTNFLGPFALTMSLMPALMRGAVAKSHHRFKRCGQYGNEENQLRRSSMGAFLQTLDRVLPIEAGGLDVRG